MAHESDDFLPGQDAHSPNPQQAALFERVQELTWAVVDEQISEDEFRLLDNLLLSDEEARATYLDCVQLHCDLLTHYADESNRPFLGGKSPVLGFLNQAVPPMDVQPT